MKSLKITIVEDEILIAETIKLHLENQNHQVIDICISYDEAIKSHQNKPADLYILDIRLYGNKSGIDIGDYFNKCPSPVPFIYLTSHNTRPIFDQAIRNTPYGYLPKPFTKESIWLAVETAFNLFKSRNKKEETLSIFDGDKSHIINESEILFIKSEHVYSNLLLKSKKRIVTRKPLSHFVQKIRSSYLIQCHRSFIVNINFITSWNKNSLVLISGEKIPISRSKQANVLKILQSI